MKNREELIHQVKALILQGNKVLGTELSDTKPNSSPHVSEEKFHDFRISALSYLSRVFTSESVYYKNFRSEITHPTLSRTRRGIAMLEAAAKELEGEWLETTRGTLAKDLLVDMLRLAKNQHEQGNIRAAAIIAGAILEKQLRLLCQSRNIQLHNEIQDKAIAKKALQLTGEAYKKKMYERQKNKEIMAWIEIATSASDDKGGEINSSAVKKMIGGIHNFVTKASF